MYAEFRPMKTAAEQKLAQTFAGAKNRLPGSGTVAEMRARAFRRFEMQGLPHRRVEAWKYTDLRALLADPKPLAGRPDQTGGSHATIADALFTGAACRRLVFVDGAFAADRSDLAGLEPGLAICSMAGALDDGDALVASHLGQVFPVGDAAIELNTSLMGDGAVVRIAAGAIIARPLHVVFVSSGEPAATFARSLVVVEEGARATLVESHEGPLGSDYQVNAALDLVVGAGAGLDHAKIIAEGADAIHVSTLMVAIGAGARLNDFTLISGGAAVRNQLFLRFDGEGATASISGASLLKGRQHADTTLVADHRLGRCQSREMFKSVVDDEARAVFQGKIIVRPDAGKTDGKMMSQALLLSDQAEADHKPELEIFADDVQCGHGATTGALNEELKFYLMARGIAPKEAEALLIEAFVGEALDRIEHPELSGALSAAVGAWLAGRG